MRVKFVFGVLLLVLCLGLFSYLNRTSLVSTFFEPTVSSIPSIPVGQSSASSSAPEVIAAGLGVPWEIAFLPEGDVLVTERNGRLVRITSDERTAIPIEGVAARGEGGLLGLALHPDFSDNQLLYLYLTTTRGGVITNQVEQYRLEGNALFDRRVILQGIPGARNHDGGRIAFGPDGHLYIATGDAGDVERAQDTNDLAGKILRIGADGSIPADNPFSNAVYSYGHRNVQGLAWDERGQLYATEHGRSGLQSGFDELNVIRAGSNYGWPVIQGNEVRAGMETPILHSGPDETWAPGGLLHYEGYLLIPGLRGEALYVARVSDGVASDLRKYFAGEYGRLRTIAAGPDGFLYMLTSNRDGRGTPVSEDDRIIAIDPRTLGLEGI